jgi:hypothetical protein
MFLFVSHSSRRFFLCGIGCFAAVPQPVAWLSRLLQQLFRCERHWPWRFAVLGSVGALLSKLQLLLVAMNLAVKPGTERALFVVYRRGRVSE